MHTRSGKRLSEMSRKKENPSHSNTLNPGGLQTITNADSLVATTVVEEISTAISQAVVYSIPPDVRVS